jgi:hypothetical protein
VQTFYYVCVVIGGVALVGQFLLGLAGAAGHEGHFSTDHDHGADGLNLLTVRALSAGLAFFGIGGLAGLSFGLGAILSLPLGMTAGIAVMYAVARVTRMLRRFDSDRTAIAGLALGEPATVYLSIPAARGGAGKIHATVSGRLMELQAETEGDALSSGEQVVVVDLVNDDTVLVARNS